MTPSRRKRSCQTRGARKLLAPNFSRRPSVDLGKDGVEPAQTAKARLHRDLGHGQARLVDEPFSPLHPRSLGDLRGTCLHVAGELPRQLPWPYTNALIKALHVT